jgi:hypothetical protein
MRADEQCTHGLSKKKGSQFPGSLLICLLSMIRCCGGSQPPELLALPVGDSGLLTVGRRARNKADFLGDFLLTEGNRGSLTR